MGTIIFIAVLVWITYKFFKLNTALGVEAVRAYIFLEALIDGQISSEAAALVRGDITELETSVLKGIAHDIRVVHGGRQLPLIGEAYRRGMPPQLPGWYQSFASGALPTASVQRVYVAPMATKGPDKPAARNGDINDHAATAERKSSSVNLGSFEAYYRVALTELKGLSGKKAADLHFIELMDDEPLRRAYSDGVDPKELAASIWCQYTPYEEYHALVRKILIPYFKDAETVDQWLRIKDEIIRVGHSSGVHPKLIAERYRYVLSTVLNKA